MRSPIRFALAATVAALLGVQPAFAQQPEAELKKAQEQLEKLLKELKDREAKKPEAAKPPVPPAPPAPPAPPKIAWAQLHGGDALAAIKPLIASKDPKVAALAKELLEHLAKAVPQPAQTRELHLELVKPAQGGGALELKLASDMLKAVPAPPGQFEFKVVPFPGGGEAAKGEPKTVERRVVVVEGKPTDGHKTVTATVVEAKPAAPAGGASTLKLSSDGKTAALLAADGTITIFDVASGKEMMKFTGKK
jgi:hypothetical protein